jgi:outer membrane protein OmpA-like peptidoglycan-associated protein
MHTTSAAPQQVLNLLRALLVAVLAALALPAAAAQGSLLELYFGPHETEWLELKTLKVALDGAELQLTLPAPGADPARPIYSGALAPGRHTLQVDAGLEGDSQVFSYVERYLFTMSEQVGLGAPPAEVVSVQAMVIADGGITVNWTERYRLALRATHYRSDRAAAVEAPAVARAPEAAPAPSPAAAAPVPAPAPDAVAVAPSPALESVPTKTKASPARPAAAAQASAGTTSAPGPARCTLEPVRFEFSKADLGDAARTGLDRLAACLTATSVAIVLEGHADPQGPADYNEWLGEERAKAAAAHLKERGVPASRLTIRTAGATRLVCTGVGPACNSLNRRVEIVPAN